jgi:membrane protease YdiL (CAAX protease family)
LFAGALIAYPLYRILEPFTGMGFDNAVIHATQLAGLVFALAYLAWRQPLSRQSIGWRPADGRYLAPFLAGFAWGVVILAILIAGLVALGIQHPVPGRDTGPAAVTVLCIKAVLTGLAVGLFEETLFRGALLGGLMRRTGPAFAVVVISLIYAAVHFIHYPATAHPGWLSGPRQFPAAYLAIFNPAILDAFLALFVLGLLLGLMRLRSGHIIGCIGLHAGLVAMIKVARYFYRYTPGSRFDFLVSIHDRRLGYLALLILAAAFVAYHLRTRTAAATGST